MTLPISPASQADVFAGANPLCDRRSTVGPGEEFREGPRWAGRRQLGGKYLPRVVSPYLFNGVGNKMVSLFSELLTEEKKKKENIKFFTENQRMAQMQLLLLGHRQVTYMAYRSSHLCFTLIQLNHPTSNHRHKQALIFPCYCRITQAGRLPTLPKAGLSHSRFLRALPSQTNRAQYTVILHHCKDTLLSHLC